MNSHANASALTPSSDQREAILGTLPLLLLGAFLLVSAYFLFLLDPVLGPRIFPLWALFVVLGGITSVGAFVSWVYAEDRPTEPAAAPFAAPVTVGSPAADWRGDFGRPSPDVARPVLVPSPPATATEPWNEDLIPLSATPAPPPPAPVPEEPSDIARALDEIAEIQRELMARRVPPKRTPADSAERA
jgi:hypothetical protein